MGSAALPGESSLEIVEYMEVRQIHYGLAHVALRTVAFENPPMFFGVMVSDEVQDFLAHLLGVVQEQVPGEEASFTAEDLVAHSVRIDDFPTVVIEFPAPVAQTEVYFIGAVLLIDESGNVEDASVRFYTLEKADGGLDSIETVLGEWSKDGTHGNLGKGPKPTPELFAEALGEQLSRTL